MDVAAAEAWVAQYVSLAQLHATTDYAQPESVAAANSAADEMRELAKRIARFEDAPALFERLMGDQAAGIWAAHHTLEILGATGKLGEIAVKVIETRALVDTGEAIWLRGWRAGRSGA